MKTTTGSLIKRGSNYYCFWRIKGKAFCKALRDEAGQAISHKADAERAKTKLMEIVGKQNRVESLRTIQHAIDDTQYDIAELEAAQNPDLTIKLAWNAFERSPRRDDCSEATLKEYGYKWKRFLEWIEREHPAKMTLRDVDNKTAEDYMASLNHGKLAPATYNFHLMTAKYIFSVLKDDARLAINPWEGIKRKTKISSTRRELTIDELKKVCQSAAGELRVILCIGLYTGLRLGDCCTLRWCEVDLRRNQIRRVPNKIARKNPKTVTIPIHPVLRAMLAEIPDNERGEFILPKTADIYLNGSRPLVTRAIQKHFRACGIKTTKANTNGRRASVEVGFHSLRHTFVSICRESGAALSVVESLVGHNSVDMTRYYTHTSELAATNAVALLPGVMGDAEAVKPTKCTPGEILREIRTIARRISAKNWREQKAALLAMLAGESCEGLR
jgi:integrase